jgi:hypothetical protein
VVDKDLMDMLVRELKDELQLESRSEFKTGNKAWLRRPRRLHGAIVRDHLARRGLDV